MTFRGLFFTIHRYLGLIAAIPLILAGLSGAVLVFEAELDRALNPSYWTVRPQGQPLSWQHLIDIAGRERPGDPVTSFGIPPAPDVAASMGLKSGLSVTVDPYTGHILGTRRRDQILMTRVHQFHVSLLMGRVGGWITGISSAILLVLSVSGLVLWWRRKGFGIKWAAPWRRVNYDAHHALGIYFLLPWIILGLTGTAIGFEKWAQSSLYFITRSTPAAIPELVSKPIPNGVRITVDAALGEARKILPGANPSAVSIPDAPPKSKASSRVAKPAAGRRPGAFLIFLKFPEDHTPAGRSRVALDQFTGAPVWIVNSRTAPAGARAWILFRPIHTGDIFGWPTRILACVSSALLAWQSVSGVWMWWPRKKRKGAASELAAV